MVFIEMQQYKGPGNKKFCNIHSKSSLLISSSFLIQVDDVISPVTILNGYFDDDLIVFLMTSTP